MAQQEEQIQLVAKESQREARRLASAIETLNGDRDRLYSRVTVLEQGLETMTGAIAKQQVAASPPLPPPAARVNGRRRPGKRSAAAGPEATAGAEPVPRPHLVPGGDDDAEAHGKTRG